MSLSGALYNAFSGLTANARGASIVSTNIANANTESYGRRELLLSPAAAGSTGGVRVDGIYRHIDPVLMSDRLVSDASLANSEALYEFDKRLESLVGASGEPGSLAGRVTQFESALLTAASNPASNQRLDSVATRAQDVALTLNDLSDKIQISRQGADSAIASQVDRLNKAIQRLDQINEAVITSGVTGSDAASLLDERQRLLDDMSAIVPLRVVTREKGDIAVFTRGGAILLDGPPFEVGFTTTAAIDPSMTMAGSQLSGLTLNGRPVDSTGAGFFAGGSLAAQFEIRDEVAVTRQNQLDSIARDLIERLGPTLHDAAAIPGGINIGIFTDGNALFDPADETGIAGRITLNSALEPGGATVELWREGLDGGGSGYVGDARRLQNISDALGAAMPPAPAAPSFADRISEYTSIVVGSRVEKENRTTFLTTQNTALRELELAKGVDTDQELQRLMQIEQHYTANAKVMSTVDELLERLMAI